MPLVYYNIDRDRITVRIFGEGQKRDAEIMKDIQGIEFYTGSKEELFPAGPVFGKEQIWN